MTRAGLVSAEDVQAFIRLCQQPQTFYVPPLIVTAWGRKPD